MDEAVALRQIRKLWKGSGLRVVACPLPVSSDEAMASASTADGDATAASSSSSPAGPRRQTLADFDPSPEPTPPPPPPPPPKPSPRPPPRRPDIGLALGIGRCTEGPRQVVPLGKAHGKRPAAEVAAEAAAAKAEADEAERKHAFLASEEQKLEAQRLQRALELENVANHPMIIQRSLDAWQREGIAV